MSDALDSKNSEQKGSLQRRWSPCEAEVLNFLCVLVRDFHLSKVFHSNLFISGKSLKIIKMLTPIFSQMLTCDNTISKGQKMQGILVTKKEESFSEDMRHHVTAIASGRSKDIGLGLEPRG